MNRKAIYALMLTGFLAACSPRIVTRTEIKTVQVPVRVACPDAETYQSLKTDRPVPLRSQPMPPTAEERVAASQAQLGRYEAEGAWADQVGAAMARCQQGLAN